MAINEIGYADKSNINTSSVPAQNKITDDDMNEIKTVVNGNANLMGDLTSLSTSDNTSLVNAINEVLGKPDVTSSEYQNVIKYDNGLMINISRIPYSSVAVTTAWGGTFASSSRVPASYDIAFTEVFGVVGSAMITNANHWFMFADGSGSLTRPPSFQLLRGSSGTVSGTMNIVTIGKWK